MEVIQTDSKKDRYWKLYRLLDLSLDRIPIEILDKYDLNTDKQGELREDDERNSRVIVELRKIGYCEDEQRPIVMFTEIVVKRTDLQ